MHGPLQLRAFLEAVAQREFAEGIWRKKGLVCLPYLGSQPPMYIDLGSRPCSLTLGLTHVA